MKKILVTAAVALSLFSLTASAAELISKDEAHHFKYHYVGKISVGATSGEVSSPSDLHKKLSDEADKKGGKYYVIIAAREHGPNFEANAEVFK
ncbi:DUF1471 domain-containing protein [Rouxiella badensis]|jgi:hypothetical protein|uniref:YdgH/BhsA/McbA-like domain-containing protein n=1 Tax=Rouxiella badensis TaxID=1646377 RepID=A0A1X0WJZ3_9GAMM|nr:DUF1471 domain-containing protein [Rouxiella badensis]MCC3702405.1 DUF1471 domain-containing protein [Rouxiella badensis]MCC3718588.1 DUF1471 domain-containing protein [Rouxiella badensis]MCC3728073.1 DUF1471 domain-containing protein [Rouxiella badensis]MCC3732759.1 DUF1471 domain-containing protein [Rouxiella badensis]MCC3739817.1 DUF1471 domain-containing protein [Rouxiella badensis]